MKTTIQKRIKCAQKITSHIFFFFFFSLLYTHRKHMDYYGQGALDIHLDFHISPELWHHVITPPSPAAPPPPQKKKTKERRKDKCLPQVCSWREVVVQAHSWQARFCLAVVRYQCSCPPVGTGTAGVRWWRRRWRWAWAAWEGAHHARSRRPAGRWCRSPHPAPPSHPPCTTPAMAGIDGQLIDRLTGWLTFSFSFCYLQVHRCGPFTHLQHSSVHLQYLHSQIPTGLAWCCSCDSHHIWWCWINYNNGQCTWWQCWQV